MRPKSSRLGSRKKISESSPGAATSDTATVDKGKGGPYKGGLKRKKSKRIQAKHEQPEDVVVICSDDEQQEKSGKRMKSVKELTAKAIVDEVTRNLKRKALFPPPAHPSKVLPRQPPVKCVNMDMKTPMQYFMFQYKILESCSAPKNGSSEPNSYGFLTFIMKRFLVCAAKLIQQVDPNFSLPKWNRSFLREEIRMHPIPVSESSATSSYFESVFGRLPGNKVKEAAKNVFPPPPAKYTQNNTENKTPEEQEIHNKVSSAIRQLELDIQKQGLGSAPSNLNGNDDDHDDDNDVYDGGDNNDDDDVQDVNNEQLNPDTGAVEVIESPVPQIKISDTPIGALEAVKPKSIRGGGKNIKKLLCTYCNHGGFDFIGRYISHMMSAHFSKKVVEFLCEKCNQNAVISSKSSLASCINHANGKCLEMRNEKAKEQFNDDGLTFLRCGFCGFKTEATYDNDMVKLDTDIMVDHYIKTHNAEYSCDTCHKCFNTIDIFEFHKEYCPEPRLNEIGIVEKPELHYYMQSKCGVHNITFKDEFEYADHSLQFHLLDISGGEICRVLDLDLPTLTARRDSKLGLTFPCNICGREQLRFKTAKEWSGHASEQHGNAGSQCPICCKFLGCIKQHNRNTHSILDEHFFPCNVDGCKYKASLFENVICHLKYFHEMENLSHKLTFNKCCAADDCDFSVEIDYVDGSLSKNYKKQTRSLCKHHEREHQKKLCDKCGRYVSKSYYDRHLESHMAEETGEKKYSCNVCNKPFTHHKSMLDHKKRHDVKNKTHICEQCGKSFYTGGDLCTHVKISHATDADKQFFCGQCNKGFARRGLLRQHLRQTCGGEAANFGSIGQGHRVQTHKRSTPYKQEQQQQHPSENRRHELSQAVANIMELPTSAHHQLDSGGMQGYSGNSNDKDLYQAAGYGGNTLQERQPSISPDDAETEVPPQPGAATDLRVPILHSLDSFDPHNPHNVLQQRGDGAYAHNIMNSFGRLSFPGAGTTSAQRDSLSHSLEPQTSANMAAFLSQFHYQ